MSVVPDIGEDWPRPTTRGRLIACAIAALWAAICLQRTLDMTPGRPADFDHLWFGARALFSGENPYLLIGPGRAFDPAYYLYYPATTLVALSPLAMLPVAIARVAFVSGSAALLCWGLTRSDWWRVALFVSGPFFNAAGAGQWSTLIAASFLIPKLAGLVAVKPTVGFAVFTSVGKQRDQLVAIAVGLALLAASLLLLPSWPRHWLASTKLAPQVTAPISHITVGAPIVLLALTRWRRPEARLLTALACIPQSTLIYEGLYFLLLPATPHGALLFSLLSWIPYFIQGWINDHSPSMVDVHWRMGNVMILCFYFPALVMILRRPNEGEVPKWLDAFVATVRRKLRR